MKMAIVLGVSPAYLLGLTDIPIDNDVASADASPDRITFEVRDVELRSAIIELVSILREMTPAERRYFVDMAQKLQHLMESSSENKAPIIIG